MSNKPAWLTKGAIVCHRPTAYAFRATSLKRNPQTGALLIETQRDTYPVEECEPITLDWFLKEKRCYLINGKPILIRPTPEGLWIDEREFIEIRVIDGRYRMQWHPTDEVELASRALAQMFGGAIVREVDLTKFGMSEG